jgi:insulysin
MFIFRFAQFFISPLFDPSSTERELLAVDSENQKNLQSDMWRIDQLEKSTCRPDHPYSKFGTGNLSTLKTEPEKQGLNVRDELLKFHSNYYSANLMTLCLVGKESLDELQQYAVDMFSDIPNKQLKMVDFDPLPYGRDFKPTIKQVVSVKDLKSLSINWTIPDYRDLYEASPASYWSHLIGHEGNGSLLSELKKKGWVNHL